MIQKSLKVFVCTPIEFWLFKFKKINMCFLNFQTLHVNNPNKNTTLYPVRVYFPNSGINNVC